MTRSPGLAVRAALRFRSSVSRFTPQAGTTPDSWTWPRTVLHSGTDDRDAGVLETAKGTLLVTTFTSLAYEPALKKAEAARPFGRLLKPDEVARACGFLSSEESGMMTGAIIDFDQQVAGTGNSIPEPPAV